MISLSELVAFCSPFNTNFSCFFTVGLGSKTAAGMSCGMFCAHAVSCGTAGHGTTSGHSSGDVYVFATSGAGRSSYFLLRKGQSLDLVPMTLTSVRMGRRTSQEETEGRW